MFLLLAYGGSISAAEPDAPRLESPQAEESLSGNVTLQASWPGMPDGGSVSYTLNDRKTLASGLGEAPFEYAWPTAEIYDGPMLLRVNGHDATGAVVSQSAPVPVTLDNIGGVMEWPGPDLSEPLSGVVEWTVVADRQPLPDEENFSPGKPIEALVFYVNGKLITRRFGHREHTIELDTRTLPNGEHELFASAWAFTPGVPPVSMKQRVVRIDNGHSLMAVRPRWNELHLRPGESIALEPRAHFTDGKSEPWTGAIRYISENPDVVTVDNDGNVTAVAPGTVRVTLDAEEAPRSPGLGGESGVWITVADRLDRPQFTRDGEIINEYDPERSLFVRSMFNLDTGAIRRNPEMVGAIKDAGINTLSGGIYPNPIRSGQPESLEEWLKVFDNYWTPQQKILEEYDFVMLAIGDDICRTRNELYNSITNPWSADAIRTTLETTADSKVVIGIDMVDEISGIWGSQPFPDDGRWQNREPHIPDDAFDTLLNIIHGSENRLPMSWPTLGKSSPGVFRNWNDDPRLADYYSHFWTYMDWRRAYPWGGSTWQTGKEIVDTLWNRREALENRKPELMLISTTGPFYRKLHDADEYTPGKDQLLMHGIESSQIPMQILLAAGEGAVGVRCYAYDGLWMRQRSAPFEPERRRQLQTGAAPEGPGAERWAAMRTAMNTLAELEPLFLQPSTHAVDLGPWIETGARSGPEGALLVAVNLSELPVEQTVDLSPYFNGSTTRKVERRRITGDKTQVEQVEANSETLRFAPGEAVVWSFTETSS